ncbi:MAG: HNH endonuclease signature motif containing protein [Methanoregula sp.]
MEEIEDSIASAEEDSPDIPEDEDSSFDSWTTGNGTAVVKKTDRHVFLYRETVLPEKVQEFFSVAGLQPGKKRKIVLWHTNHRFDAFIEKTLHDPPVTRLRWNQEFAMLLRTTWPGWFELFKKSRSGSSDTPSLSLSRRQVPDEYEVGLEGAPEETAATDVPVPVRPGDVIDNDTLMAIFRCSSQGAMRRSPGTNSLVLVSDHTRPACEDRWIGKTFHFTGRELSGEPGFSFNQNRALFESSENGTRLFLFEVFSEGAYTYTGDVELAENPYLSRQADREKTMRDVTVFPLKRRENNRSPLPEKAVPAANGGVVPAKEQKVPPGGPGFAARSLLKEEGGRNKAPDVFGDQIVAEYAKRQAAGICQLCRKPAPFKSRGGEPYLETHHIIPLTEGGQDRIENVVALCPNCHRKMHVLNLPADEVRLKNRVSVRD